jgi:hypothetical protein
MKKIIAALVFSLLAVGITPAVAIDPPVGWTYPTPSAPTIISQSDPFCSEPDKRCDGVSVVIDTPLIPDFDSNYMSALYLKVGSTGASITNGQKGVVVSGLAYGKAHTAVISYYTSEGPQWVTHYGTSVSFVTIAMANATPTPTNSAASTNSQINVGIWLISGRTSEIYGRGDGIADSQNQIQWVTCLESPSGSMLYPNRDNLNYTYTVTGPAGVVATGDYRPTWIDSMSSCTGNSGGSQYSVAYNLSGLSAGTTYQFTVNGSNAGSSFSSTKSFTTLPALSVAPTNTPTSSETKTATTPTVAPETSTSISTPAPTVVPVPVSDTPTSSSAPAPTTSAPAPTTSAPAPTTSAPAPTTSAPAPTTSAPAPTSSETQSAVASVAPVAPIAPTSSVDPDSGLDEVEAEEEIIDSIDAVVQSNGTTRIEVSTGYIRTALTVVATKKGSKKKYTYKITTNADGDRKFKSGLNLRGYTVVLYKGSTELDRMYIS